jgi:hypothetical protein
MCQETGLSAPLHDGFFPPTTTTLVLFASFLAESGVQSATIKAHMTAVRRRSRELDLPDPYTQDKLPAMVAATITGNQREWALTHPPKALKQAFPITVAMVHTLAHACDCFESPYDAALVRVLIVLSQASGGRVSDYLPSSSGKYNARIHFSLDGISAVDNKLTLLIQSSKTDRLYEGRRLVLIDQPGPLSILSALQTWLQFRRGAVQPDWPTALFIKSDGTPYATQHFRGAIAHLVKYTKLPVGITGHSFRRGGTSTLANAGFSSAVLQRHGNWKSDVFKRYIDVSDDMANQIAGALAIRPTQSLAHVPTRRA